MLCQHTRHYRTPLPLPNAYIASVILERAEPTLFPLLVGYNGAGRGPPRWQLRCSARTGL